MKTSGFFFDIWLFFLYGVIGDRNYTGIFEGAMASLNFFTAAASSSGSTVASISSRTGEKLFLRMSAVFSRDTNCESIASVNIIIAFSFGSFEVRSISLAPLTD